MSTKLIEQVVELTNVERAKAGLQPLKLNNQLVDAARDHSNDMAQDDFFSHTGADGSTVGDRVKDSGYQYSTTGENIAAGQTTAAEVVEGWMNSPGHRANILNPDYTEIGVGYEYLQNDTGSINYNHYWTQVFGTPLNDNSAGSELESPMPEVSQPVPVASVEEASNSPEIEETSNLPSNDIPSNGNSAGSELESPVPEVSQPVPVESVEEASNSPEIEETSDLLVENTANNGQSNSMEDLNDDIFDLDNSASPKASYEDSLTGRTDDSALTGGDGATDFVSDFGGMRRGWYLEQFKDNFSELLNDSWLGSAVDSQENSEFVDFVECISKLDLAGGKQDLASEMSDSFM